MLLRLDVFNHTSSISLQLDVGRNLMGVAGLGGWKRNVLITSPIVYLTFFDRENQQQLKHDGMDNLIDVRAKLDS